MPGPSTSTPTAKATRIVAYVSLFVVLASEGNDFRALFELTLLDQSGKDNHKVHSQRGRVTGEKKKREKEKWSGEGSGERKKKKIKKEEK